MCYVKSIFFCSKTLKNEFSEFDLFHMGYFLIHQASKDWSVSFYWKLFDFFFSVSFIKDIFVDRGQQSHLIVPVSHDNSINRDNRIFIILWDFILIFSGSLCCRYCALVQRCVSPTGSWNVEEYTLKFVARYRGGLKYWPVPGNTFPWNFSYSFP